MIQELFQQVKSRVAMPIISAADKKVNVPTDLLWRCPRCGNVVMMDDYEKNHKVCASCSYHSRLSAFERLALTADPDSFVELDPDMKSVNPLEFRNYPKKLEQLQRSTGLRDAILTGECTIKGHPCVIGIMDSRFLMASMGSVVGEKIARAFEHAAKLRLPVILFTASGGARMQEGIISLMQMAKTAGAVSRHNAAGLLYITVLTDPTTGGVTARFASLGDIIIAEPKVLVGFAGRRVIEGTIKEKLPDDFQTAEFLLEHGFVDMIVSRHQLRRTLGHILKMHIEKPAGEVGENG